MMTKETKALNEILLEKGLPKFKTPVIQYGRKTNPQYMNAITNVKGSNIESVVDKEIFDAGEYEVIRKKGYGISKFLFYEIKDAGIFCILEFWIRFDIDYDYNHLSITAINMYDKNKKRLNTIRFSADHMYSNFPIVYDDATTMEESKRYVRKFAKSHGIKIGSFYGISYGGYDYCGSNVFASMKNAIKRAEDGKIGINGETFEELVEVAVSFFGGNIKSIGGSKVVDITENSVNLSKYLSYKEPIGMSDAKVKNDKFLNIELPEVSYDESFDDCIGVINKVDEHLCVLRTLIKDKSNKKMIEKCKIFVDNKKAYGYKTNDFGTWLKMRLSSSVDTLSFKLTGYNSANTDGTMLEYFGTIVKEIPEDKQDMIIKFLLSDSFLEQLLKSEMKDFVLKILLNPHEGFNYTNFKNTFFGEMDKKQKGMYKKLGLNKYQFTRFAKLYSDFADTYDSNNYWYLSRSVALIPELKSLLDPDFRIENYYYSNSDKFIDVSFLDNNTFDIIVDNFLKDGSDNAFLNYNIPKIIYKMFGLQTLIKMTDGYLDAFNAAYNDGNWNICFLYRDYLVMLDKMKRFKDFSVSSYKPYFNKRDVVNSIQSMHDLITELYNTRENEIKLSAFTNETKKLDKWEFKTDKFMVIKPKAPDDLAIEGITLHHCVKSYIDRVSSGYTNIMFIRETSDKTKPYFTVEISNIGSIEQIHGFANCNVESGSELEKFVKEWCKEKKLRTNNINKIR